MAIKKILLRNSSEGMILAQDVVDQHGRILIASGISLKQEVINLLEKHNVSSLFIKDHITPNYEITMIPDVVNIETRLKLISTVRNAFCETDGLMKHLVELRSYIEDVVHTVVQRNNVLMYLNDIDDTSDYLFMHSVNVGLFCIAIGTAMNLSHEDLCLLGMGGLLHDLGKTKISPHIINKQGILTRTEFNEIKEHASLGYSLLRDNVQLDYRILFMALQHHERCDGSGYPWGITKDIIHPLARIVAVADIYDALTTDRVYRARLTSFAALQIINEGNHIHFDAAVMAALNQIAIPYPIGCNVTLSSGENGKVVRLNSSNLLRPLVSTMQGIMNLLYEPERNIIAVI